MTQEGKPMWRLQASDALGNRCPGTYPGNTYEEACAAFLVAYPGGEVFTGGPATEADKQRLIVLGSWPG